MPACMNLCGRQDDQAIVKERCILCGENKCSGCNALLQKDYRHGVSERRTRHRAGHSSEASDEAGSHRDMPDLSGTRDSCRHQKSKGSMRASVKKDACFYSQGTVSSEQDGDGESESGHERVAPRHQRLQVWFREPNICRQKEKGVMLVPGEYTEYEFVLQWGERRWAVRRRYREFSALDRALDETLPESVQLPEFPPKATFNRMSPSLVCAVSCAVCDKTCFVAL